MRACRRRRTWRDDWQSGMEEVGAEEGHRARGGPRAGPVRGVDPELNSAVKSGTAATDERVGLFTPDKDGHTHTSCGRVAVIARRGAGPSVARWVASPDFVNSRSIPSMSAQTYPSGSDYARESRIR